MRRCVSFGDVVNLPVTLAVAVLAAVLSGCTTLDGTTSPAPGVPELSAWSRPEVPFSVEPGADGATVYSRMFAPEAGVVEDPATGGASGPLGGYLVRHGLVAPSAAGDIVSAQGVKMGRPSRLRVRVEATSPSDITRVHVGGTAVKVGDGTIVW